MIVNTYLLQLLFLILRQRFCFQFFTDLIVDSVKGLIHDQILSISFIYDSKHETSDDHIFQKHIKPHRGFHQESDPKFFEVSQKIIIFDNARNYLLVIFNIFIDFRCLLCKADQHFIGIAQQALFQIRSVLQISKHSIQVRIIIFLLVGFLILPFPLCDDGAIGCPQGENICCFVRVDIALLIIVDERVRVLSKIVNEGIKNFGVVIQSALINEELWILQKLEDRWHFYGRWKLIMQLRKYSLNLVSFQYQPTKLIINILFEKSLFQKSLIIIQIQALLNILINPSMSKQNQKPKQAAAVLEDNPTQPNPLQLNVDGILTRLLELSSQKPGKKVKITEQQIYGIIRCASNEFAKEDILLQLKAPLNICGDIHGQYYDLLRIFTYGGLPPTANYLFLGDYVDRGQYGIQTICLLFCLKIKFPNNIFLLRGNHETASISRIYGFYNQCKQRYDSKVWKAFVSSFGHLPVAALIEGRIICMHGGLSPLMHEVKEIRTITRPTDVPDQGLICDLLWADPTVELSGWAQSERGCSYVFGSDVTASFLRANDLDLVCRAHQVVQDGYQFCHRKRVVTLFSAPNYCGQFNNAGAFMQIDSNLTCSFRILKPDDKPGPFKNSRPKNPQKEQIR